MEIKNIPPLSRKILWILGSIAGFVVALLIFQAGMYVGYNKATDAYLWGELYSRGNENPAGGRLGSSTPLGSLGMGDISDTEGELGVIVKTTPPKSIIVEEQNGVEKTVLIASTTAIRQFKETLAPGDLTVGNNVIIFGPPNDQGQVEAELIRVLPLPPAGTPTAPEGPNAN